MASGQFLPQLQLATWWEEPTHWKRPWCWERLRAGGKGDDRGWDGWVASLTQWTWVWANSRRWWRTGKPGLLQSRSSQSIRQNWATEQQLSELFKTPVVFHMFRLCDLLPISFKSLQFNSAAPDTIPKNPLQSREQCPSNSHYILYMCMLNCSVMSNSLWSHGLSPTRLLCSWDSPGKNTGVGCHFLLQGIFLTQGSNQSLLHCGCSPALQADFFLSLSHQTNHFIHTSLIKKQKKFF